MNISTRLEGIAAELRTAAGSEVPVNALDLAACCGLTVEYSDVPDALLYDDTIYVSRHARMSRVHLLVAHELGHWALQRARQDDRGEADVDYVAAATLVPWDELRRTLRSGWDLEEQRARHAFTPASTIAQRIAQVRGGSAAIFDGLRLKRRIGSVVLEREIELVSEVLATQRPVRIDDLSGAWPVIDGVHRRVIVLAAPPD